MSIFNRVSREEQPKIPIWPLITDMTRVLDNTLSFEDFSTIYNLNTEERAEAGQYLNKIGQMVQERAAKLAMSGIEADLAIELARSIVFVKFWHALIRCENETITQEEFNASFGIQL